MSQQELKKSDVEGKDEKQDDTFKALEHVCKNIHELFSADADQNDKFVAAINMIQKISPLLNDEGRDFFVEFMNFIPDVFGSGSTPKFYDVVATIIKTAK